MMSIPYKASRRINLERSIDKDMATELLEIGQEDTKSEIVDAYDPVPYAEILREYDSDPLTPLDWAEIDYYEEFKSNPLYHRESSFRGMTRLLKDEENSAYRKDDTEPVERLSVRSIEDMEDILNSE